MAEIESFTETALFHQHPISDAERAARARCMRVPAPEERQREAARAEGVRAVLERTVSVRRMTICGVKRGIRIPVVRNIRSVCVRARGELCICDTRPEGPPSRTPAEAVVNGPTSRQEREERCGRAEVGRAGGEIEGDEFKEFRREEEER